jgi:hypothetical protein
MKFWKKERITEETTKEYKYVALMTYATEDEIKRVLEEKKPYIKGVSYIFHDKETAEPHYHIALELKRSRKGQAIIRWFKGLKDSKGELANTFGEEVISVSGLHDYFTHSDEISIKEGKHQYTEEDIKVIEGIPNAWDYVTAWEKAEAQAEAKEQKADEVEQMLDDIINEVPAREMARKYGRDFMKNASQYRKFASEVVLEETQDLVKAIKLGRFESTVIDKAVTEATNHVLECVAIRITDCYSKNVEPTLNDLLESLSLK